MPLEERLRRGIVPRRGFCSIAPAADALLISGNGPINIDMTCDPYSEQITFRHESIFVPHKHFEAPNIAGIFPQVRQMMLEGKYHEAAKLAYDEWHKSSLPQGGGYGGGPAFEMRLDYPKTASVKDYLRTVDFESTELKVHWTDERGEWVRRIFTSRPDNVVVQSLTAPKGQSLNVRITLGRATGGPFGGIGFAGGGLGEPLSGEPPRTQGFFGRRGEGAQGEFHTDYNEQRLIFKGVLDPSVNNSGYAGVTRVVRDGGSARMEGDTLVVENASSVMLLTRIEHFPDYSEEQVEALRQAVEQLTPDYAALLERARKVQSEMLNRVTVDFGGASKNAMSSEELLVRAAVEPRLFGRFSREVIRNVPLLVHPDQRQVLQHAGRDQRQYQPADCSGRAGRSPRRHGGLLQLDGKPRTPTTAPTQKTSSGCAAPIMPSRRPRSRASIRISTTPLRPGKLWPHPYWLSAGGWCVRPFWDHYLVTGDMDFLRNRVVPAYKDLALFYEDFLTVTDKNGNYIFVPSFSPENNPGNLNPGCMAVINTSMDISVCREVLGNLVEACELLGIEGR